MTIYICVIRIQFFSKYHNKHWTSLEDINSNVKIYILNFLSNDSWDTWDSELRKEIHYLNVTFFVLNLFYNKSIGYFSYSFLTQLITILFPGNFLHLVVFHRSLSDSKSPQMFKSLLSILAYFNSSVVWMVTVLLLVSSLPCLFLSLLLTVSSVSNTNGITVTFMLHNVFSFLRKVQIFD